MKKVCFSHKMGSLVQKFHEVSVVTSLPIDYFSLFFQSCSVNTQKPYGQRC